MTDPGRMFEYDVAHRTDVGQVRKINEDTIYVSDKSQLWLVADGMGGHAAGDFASQTIAGLMETLGVPLSWEDFKHRFAERLNQANERILKHTEELGRGAIGSTIAALMALEDRFVCCWSGDSRVYRFRAHRLRQVTKDHTEVQALLDSGQITQDQAATWPRKNVITQAIGVSDVPEFDMIEGRLVDGDVFLICSDGLTEYFGDEEIEKVLDQHGENLHEACDHLVGEAVERGGKDNVSAVVVRASALPLQQMEVTGDYPEFRGLL